MNRRSFLVCASAVALVPSVALAEPTPRERALRHGFKVGLVVGEQVVGFFREASLGPKRHDLTLKKGYLVERELKRFLEGDPDRPRAVRLFDLENEERKVDAPDAVAHDLALAPDLKELPEGLEGIAEVTLTSKRGFGVGPVADGGPIQIAPLPSP